MSPLPTREELTKAIEKHTTEMRILSSQINFGQNSDLNVEEKIKFGKLSFALGILEATLELHDEIICPECMAYDEKVYITSDFTSIYCEHCQITTQLITK